jgi:hypothetical protein
MCVDHLLLNFTTDFRQEEVITFLASGPADAAAIVISSTTFAMGTP